jgi:hypothetical protein
VAARGCEGEGGEGFFDGLYGDVWVGGGHFGGANLSLESSAVDRVGRSLRSTQADSKGWRWLPFVGLFLAHVVGPGLRKVWQVNECSCVLSTPL